MFTILNVNNFFRQANVNTNPYCCINCVLTVNTAAVHKLKSHYFDNKSHPALLYMFTLLQSFTIFFFMESI